MRRGCRHAVAVAVQRGRCPRLPVDHIRRYNTPPGTLVLQTHGAGKLILPGSSRSRLVGLAATKPDLAEVRGGEGAEAATELDPRETKRHVARSGGCA
jgi:hypothetical protein